MKYSHRVIAAGVVAASLVGATFAVRGAEPAYPTKPIRLIIPYPPGGSVDFTGRQVSQRFGEALGQQVLVDTRGGAGSTLGHAMTAAAAPDGYTLMIATSAGLVGAPALGMKIPYDPQKDFAPVSMAAYVPFALVINGALPANNLQELIKLAKSQPGKLNYGSPGAGTPNHLGFEWLNILAGIQLVHVPYKGVGPALIDVIAGRLQMMFSGIPQVQPFIKSGKVKAIAVGHPTHTQLMPDLPPIAATFPGFSVSAWHAVVAPAKTSPAIIARLNAIALDVFRSPEYAKGVLAEGVEPTSSTPDEVLKLIGSELPRWRQIIKDAGITPE